MLDVCIFYARLSAVLNWCCVVIQCPEVGCLQAFKKHSQLTMHLIRHSGDLKPFKCSQEDCLKAYALPSELRKHQKCHKGIVLMTPVLQNVPVLEIGGDRSGFKQHIGYLFFLRFLCAEMMVLWLYNVQCSL